MIVVVSEPHDRESQPAVRPSYNVRITAREYRGVRIHRQMNGCPARHKSIGYLALENAAAVSSGLPV
jgi:hypothetical protein